MLTSFLSGFGMGMSLILAIGPQNAFVLRQGLRGEHVAAIVAVCVLSDVALIAAGVAGFSALVQTAPWIVPALRWGGAAFLAAYAVRAGLAAWRGGESLQPGGQAEGIRRAVMACLALTWLNPHVYIDTLVLLGAVSVKQPNPTVFGLGAALASLVFFVLLGFGARIVRPYFARPLAWRLLDALVALTLAILALRLVIP